MGFDWADIGIVGDCATVLPALAGAFRRRRPTLTPAFRAAEARHSYARTSKAMLMRMSALSVGTVRW